MTLIDHLVAIGYSRAFAATIPMGAACRSVASEMRYQCRYRLAEAFSRQAAIHEEAAAQARAANVAATNEYFHGR